MRAQHPRHREADERRASGRPSGPGSAVPGLLAMQRTAGNAAVVRAIRAEQAAVQRMPADTRPIINAGAANEWEAHNTPGRTDGLVLSGHGSWNDATPDFKVPAGTKVHLYCQHGNTVLDANGARVETGAEIAPSSTRDGRNTIPDYTLHEPSELNIHGSPVAVTVVAGGYSVRLDPTQPAAILVNDLRDPQLLGRTITFTHDVQLSALLRPNMGDVHFAACRHYDIPAMRDRTRNQS